MRYAKVLLTAAIALIAAPTSVLAQATGGPGVVGIYNPTTNTFQPLAVQTVPAAPQNTATASAPVSVGGKFVFTITVRVRTPSPETTVPTCYVSVSHYPAGHSYNESNNITGTRSGNNGRCVVGIPYAWTEADDAYPVGMSLSVYVGSRSTSRSLPSIALPSGGVTPIDVDVAL